MRMLKRRVSAGEFLHTMHKVTRLDEREGGEGSNVEDNTKRGKGSDKNERGKRSNTMQGERKNGQPKKIGQMQRKK